MDWGSFTHVYTLGIIARTDAQMMHTCPHRHIHTDVFVCQLGAHFRAIQIDSVALAPHSICGKRKPSLHGDQKQKRKREAVCFKSSWLWEWASDGARERARERARDSEQRKERHRAEKNQKCKKRVKKYMKAWIWTNLLLKWQKGKRGTRKTCEIYAEEGNWARKKKNK